MEDIERIPLEPKDQKLIQKIGSATTIFITQVNSIYAPDSGFLTVSGASGMYLLGSSTSLWAANPGFLMNVKNRFSF